MDDVSYNFDNIPLIANKGILEKIDDYIKEHPELKDKDVSFGMTVNGNIFHVEIGNFKML